MAIRERLQELANAAMDPSMERPDRSRGAGRLDAKGRALIRLGAVVATGGGPASFEHCVADALAAGVSADEIVDALGDLAPILGLARVVAAAAELSAPLGYDVDEALERIDRPRIAH